MAKRVKPKARKAAPPKKQASAARKVSAKKTAKKPARRQAKRSSSGANSDDAVLMELHRAGVPLADANGVPFASLAERVAFGLRMGGVAAMPSVGAGEQIPGVQTTADPATGKMTGTTGVGGPTSGSD